MARIALSIRSGTLRWAIMLALDAALMSLSLYCGLYARFEFQRVPWPLIQNVTLALPVLLGARSLIGAIAGLHRWSFRMAGLHEAVRLVFAQVLGTIVFVLCLSELQRPVPKSVIAFELFLTTSLLLAYRFAPRVMTSWYANATRAQHQSVQRTLIVGAANGADNLVRDLMGNPDHPYQVVGFVAHDIGKVGMMIGGKAVLGSIENIAGLVEKHRIQKVLIAAPDIDAQRIRAMLDACRKLKVTFKTVPASFSYVDTRITAAMLHDLTPEDLLPRHQVSFETAELRALIADRRILITGAGGSIGSEIARQLIAQRPRHLVLVDMNENELYFLVRRLREQYPTVRVDALVADIRDRERMLQIGFRYQPQDVFHAAAHKHVPLMEDAPQEAVKNNVFGTLNVAEMADQCGVERFVLISTDKAVAPTSVMGVSKRVAEFVIRQLQSRSKTRFTAVRFGNVLGSAGSVVPLFREQIERGGPVTVTHPECTRFFMTVSEAVGLVLIAGLTTRGELCVLDMGDPIKIADLATNMITMAGRVPGEEIEIKFTGLRPGEKLREELLTEEEEKTHIVRDKIFVAQSVPPPADFESQLNALRLAAKNSDHETIIRVFRQIVPTYRPARQDLAAPQRILPMTTETHSQRNEDLN